jgi:hypothetical protein
MIYRRVLSPKTAVFMCHDVIGITEPFRNSIDSENALLVSLAVPNREGLGPRESAPVADISADGHCRLMTTPLQHLGVTLPIVQAPMAGVSTPELAAAVSNTGGLGSIGVGATNAAGARTND